MTIKTPEYLTSEKPAIEIFQSLGYEYFDASVSDPRESINEVVLKDRLLNSIKKLNPWINENNLNKCCKKLTSILASSLMEANQYIYKLITGNNSDFSVNQVIDGREQSKTPVFIDFLNPENNDFLIVNQMKFKGKERNSIPDLVVFINGMPLAIIEAKSSTANDASDKAIGDLRYYQSNSEKLFYYNQICAGIWKVGAKYGAIGAKDIHYSVFKSDDKKEIQDLLNRDLINQDIMLYNLFGKDKFLDIIRNFVIFETSEGTTVKKLPRYQQLRAVNKTLNHLIEDNRGGVVWHTQGSGKSISMVYLATKLRREEYGFNNPTIIVMTDRIDLHTQITRTFNDCGFPNPIPATTVKHLKKLLQDDYGKTIMTTIQKFQNDELDEDGKRVKKNIEELEILSDKENVFVLVDEAHRTQYGFLAAFMRHAIPNAKFIAFTGTPIDKDEKSTLGKFYGGDYIDKYTIKQAVDDGATLPILYEDGLPELYVEKELLDKQFNLLFENEEEEKLEKLKKAASSLKMYMLAKNRVRRIAEHIIEHYKTKIYPNGHKAMLVCYNRRQAIEYKKIFEQLKDDGVHNFKTRVVMSFTPKKDPQEFFDIATPEAEVKQSIEDFKLPFGNEEDIDISGKKKFDNNAIIIVSDMLLTGYDAPIASTLYLDKLLKEHNLLQAIARVNRTRIGKNAGLIVDYCGITEHLVDALAIFSGDLEPGEVMQKMEEEKSRLDLRHSQLVAFFNHIKYDRHKEKDAYIDSAVQYIEPEDLRDEFKELYKKFNKSIDIVLPDKKALKYEYDLKLYNSIRAEARNAYIDETLKISSDDSRKLQALIDEHLRATGIRNLLDEPISVIDREAFEDEIRNTFSDKSKELKMTHRLKYTIKVELDKNPEFYKPLAERLEELIEQRKNERINQLDFLKELEAIQEKIINKNKEAERLGFNTEQEFAVFKTLENTIEGDAKVITNILFAALSDELNIVDWQNKDSIKKEMRKKIKETLRGKVEASKLNSLGVTIVDHLKRN